MTFLLDPRVRQAIRVFFWLWLAASAYALLSPNPPNLPLHVGDKFQHLTGFGSLAAVATLGFDSAKRWRVAERLSFFGALIEVIQNIPALHRSCDIFDWVADTAGIVMATALTGLFVSWLGARRAG